MRPIITDNDKDEITATLNGREIRGWSYRSDAERRDRMRMAREYVEGWCDGVRPLPGVEIIRILRCSAYHLLTDMNEDRQPAPGLLEYHDDDTFEFTCRPWFDGKTPEDASDQLNAVMRFAVEAGCDRVLFDADGPELRGFPVFEESTEC